MMISHLIIVAGVSGAGKSTFVQHALNHPGTLDLPDISDWLIYTNRSGWDDKESDGAVLDFDMEDLAAPILGMMDQAKKITVVNIRPPLNQIIWRLSEREYEMHTREEILRAKLKWRLMSAAFKPLAIVSPSLEKIIRRLTPFRVKNRIARLDRKLGMYSDSYLESLYARWDTIVQNRKNVRSINVSSFDVEA